MIGIVNYGMGNIQSVVNALDHLGHQNIVLNSPAQLEQAQRIIIPGVGSFPQAMKCLTERGFVEGLELHVRGKGKPVLGICLGMQVLAQTGMEFGERPGLGWIPGRVIEIPRTPPSLRLPHVGWNDLQLREGCPLWEGLGSDTSCYFLHSFYLEAAESEDVVATAEYGTTLCAAVQRDNIFGIQPHPEKSQDVGLRILGNFARL